MEASTAQVEFSAKAGVELRYFLETASSGGGA
jgi:hypothetical protein